VCKSRGWVRVSSCVSLQSGTLTHAALGLPCTTAQLAPDAGVVETCVIVIVIVRGLVGQGCAVLIVGLGNDLAAAGSGLWWWEGRVEGSAGLNMR
jgi:hypothetical protein